jgi:ABC-type Mn2+/Zn2+ transport system ATPase subunit
MQRRPLKHLRNNNNLSREQYGLWTKLTTENASYTLINEVLNDLNNKLTVGVICHDFKKAFHCVNHNILLSKLKLMEQLVKVKISTNLTLKTNIKEF